MKIHIQHTITMNLILYGSNYMNNEHTWGVEVEGNTVV